MSNYTFTLNMIPNTGTPVVVNLSQGDIGRELTFKLVEGSDPNITIATDASAITIAGTKPSGLGFSETCTATSGNTITVSTTEAMTQESGMIPAEVRFVAGTKDLGTANIIFAIEESPHPAGTTDGTQETMQNLEARLQTQIDDLDTRVNELEAGGGEAIYYTITNNLSNVTNGNGATSVKEGRSYTAILSLAEGAELQSITIKMGGVDITHTAWNSETMTISISSVTNNLVITANASIIIRQTVTWAGAGADKNTDTIDATQNELYWELPYIEGSSAYASGATAESDFVRIRANLYSDAEATTLVGYWYMDTKEIETGSSRTTINSPTMPTDTLTQVAPKGYYVKLIAMKRSGFYDNASCTTFLNENANIVTLKSAESEDEGDTVSNAESVDNDLLQMYSLNAVSLNTSTASDATSYAGVIETAKNAWMTEYGGSIDKIPIIIHTDQHDSMGDEASATMWETIDNMVSWYDISKVINLGDTTNSYDNFDNPLLGDANLEAYLEATKHIPFSKRIEVFGNHDCMKIIDASLTYIPQAPNYLNPYFKNVMAKRTSNNGNWCVTYDDYFNIKYIIYSNYDWLASLSDYGVTTEQYNFLIEEMSKNDGYDIILLGHTDVNIYQEHTGQLAKARYEKTSGSFTDRLGITHTYDFTGCENDLLVCLHGHSHSDAYNYTETVLSQCFANYYANTRPIYFVIVDRANRQLKVWKVTNTPAYETYTRTLTEV